MSFGSTYLTQQPFTDEVGIPSGAWQKSSRRLHSNKLACISYCRVKNHLRAKPSHFAEYVSGTVKIRVAIRNEQSTTASWVVTPLAFVGDNSEWGIFMQSRLKEAG